MAKVGHIAVEVRPTVSLESACACVLMLNLFLAENPEYDLIGSHSDDSLQIKLVDTSKPETEAPDAAL